VNLISKILDLLDPAGWVFKLVAAAAVVAAVWFAWHEFKVWVSTPMVAAAVQAEQARTAPVIKRLEDEVAAQNAAATAEKAKQTKVANEKTIQYNNVVKQNKELFAKFNAAMLSKSELQAIVDLPSDSEKRTLSVNQTLADYSLRQANRTKGLQKPKLD
jgi:hypothetical protein